MHGIIRSAKFRLGIAGVMLAVFASTSSASALTTTTISWKLTSLVNLTTFTTSSIATTNSTGTKVWSVSGSCTLKDGKVTTKTSGTCTVKLRVKAKGRYPEKIASKRFTLVAPLPYATRVGGTEFDYATSVGVLPDGSTIVTGTFTGTATFGTTTLTSAGKQDVFVAKMSPTGSWMWAIRGGGTEEDSGTAIAVAADGSSVVAGHYRASATFGTTTTSTSGKDVFVAKVSASGTWQWVTVADADNASAEGIALAADGSAVLTGIFDSAMRFGTLGDLVYTYVQNAYVAKVSSSGTWQWAVSVGSTGPEYGAWGQGIAAVPGGSFIVTGIFDGSSTFGSTTLTAAGGYDGFVGKISSAGSWTWVAQASGADTNAIKGVTVGFDGSAVVTGFFNGTTNFGTRSLTAVGEYDGFIAKLSSSGTWVSATGIGGSATEAGFDVSVLFNGSVIVTGYIQGTVNFGSTSLTVATGNAAFVAKLGADGSWAWATKVLGASESYGVSASPNGSAVVVGSFVGAASFGSRTLTSAGSNDGFVARISPLGSLS